MFAILDIYNDTEYHITINHNSKDIATVDPHETYTYVTDDNHNNDTFSLWQHPNQWYLQSEMEYGEFSGVYIDRGYQGFSEQPIVIIADINGYGYELHKNGGVQVVPQDGFRKGGTIRLTFGFQQSELAA